MSRKNDNDRVSDSSYFAQQSALSQSRVDGAPARRRLSLLSNEYTLFTLCLAGLFFLPILGAYLTNTDLSSAFVFPLTSRSIPIEGFSWPVFLVLAAFLSLFIITPIYKIISTKPSQPNSLHASAPFPLWGYIGLIAGAFFWLISWTRFEIFTPIQKHTFLFLWVSFLVVVSAVSHRISGQGPHRRYKRVFFLLFPLSALLWWAFEFINRFAQNWSYQNVENFSALEFFFYATFSFSTVLPALLVSRDILACSPRLQRAFIRNKRIYAPQTSLFWILVLLAASLFLALIPVFPNSLYPFVWVSPLLIIWALKNFSGLPTLLSPLRQGDWRDVFFWGSAGLFCGFFWEMWNIYSLAKWVYHIPYVQVLHIFEMPLLGFGGYIPFGWFSAEIIGLFIAPQFFGTTRIKPRLRTGEASAESKETPCSEAEHSEASEKSILIPTHLAIIMDGNGRWAEMRGLSRSKGHQAGALAVDRIVEESRKLGIRYLTLFAFSSENWRRPQPEVSALMSLFTDYLKKEIKRLKQNGIRLRAMGELERLPRRVQRLLQEAELETKAQGDMDLILAVSYGSRGELTHALERISKKVLEGTLKPSELQESHISEHLYLPDLPDPELIIRTSNEVRLSNFLLWQAAYAEIVVRDTLWPDFDKKELLDSLKEFGRRERRFGKVASASSSESSNEEQQTYDIKAA